jgi:predicted ATP-dependent Lon-type protease
VAKKDSTNSQMEPFSLTFKIKFDKRSGTFTATAYGFMQSGRGRSAIEAVTSALAVEENKLHLITRSAKAAVSEKFLHEEEILNKYPAGKTRDQAAFAYNALASGQLPKVARELRAIGILRLVLQGHTLEEAARVQDVSTAVIHRIVQMTWRKIRDRTKPTNLPSWDLLK